MFIHGHETLHNASERRNNALRGHRIGPISGWMPRDCRAFGAARQVVVFLVPSASLGEEEAARKALRRFRESCKLAIGEDADSPTRHDAVWCGVVRCGAVRYGMVR